MKTLISFVLFTFFLSGAIGQIIVDDPVKLKLPKGNNVVGLEQSYFLLGEDRFVISSDVPFFSISSLGRKTKKVAISKINKENEVVKSKNIEINYKKYKLYIERIFEFNNEIYILSSHVNNNNKQVYFFLNQIDRTSLKVVGELKNIGSLDFSLAGETFGGFGVQIVKKPGLDKCCITISSIFKLKSQITFKTFILDSKGELVLELNYNDYIDRFDFYDIEQIELHKDGIICLVNNCIPMNALTMENSTKPIYDINGHGIAKKSSDYHLLFFNYDGQYSLLDIDDDFPEYDARIIAEDNEVYAALISLKTNQHSYNYSVQKYSINEQKLMIKYSKELTTSFIEKDKEKLTNLNRNRDMLFVNKLILSPTGKLFVLFQDYERIETITYQANGSSTTNIAEIFGQMILLNMEQSDLSLIFSKKIMRECNSQYASIGDVLTYFNDSHELNIVANVTNLDKLVRNNLVNLEKSPYNGFLSLKWNVSDSGEIKNYSVCSSDKRKGLLETRMVIDHEDFYEVGVIKPRVFGYRKYSIIKLNKND